MSRIPFLEAHMAERWVRDRCEARTDVEARKTVEPILAAVRSGGDAALVELTRKLDGVELTDLEARPEEGRRALVQLAPKRRRALELARANIETFHRSQLRDEIPVRVADGITVWREFRPIRRVGIYVPAGRAGYPSSVLMCAVPALLAGCPEVVICAPPCASGGPPESVHAAAALLGVERVYPVGGAQAIAALAYGTETVPKVDKIFGPGNRYVTAAKELVYGAVDLDMPAGPSEIVVLADEIADPDWVAADLVSQAEHAPDVLTACVTTDAELGRRVREAVARQLQALPDPESADASVSQGAVCVAPDLTTAIEWVNRLAPEHLSIVTRDDRATLRDIANAGSVFLGGYSPVAAGDYAAGSNHVLPTGRRARAWSALSVDDFGRWMQVQEITATGLSQLHEIVPELARWEGFEAHARAVEARFREASP